MRLADLADRRIGIVGFGQEGRAIYGLLREALPAPQLRIYDEAESAADADLPLSVGPLKDAPLADHEVLILSPGISIYRPEIQRAVASGATLTTVTNLWFAEPRTAPVVAVTGTKGKSTVASLIVHLAGAAGVEATVGGNIGTPLAALWDAAAELYVIEISSYQAATFEGRPDLALLTNLYPEHLDWHGGTDRYYQDKLRLLAAAERTVVNAANATAEALTRAMRPVPANGTGRWAADASGLRRDGERVVFRWTLRGRRNLENLALALTALDCLSIDTAPGLAALEDFAALPHRQEVVAEHGGFTYVDDSIATTPHATLAALDAFGEQAVAVIVGGYDRGLDWTDFARRLAVDPIAGVIARGGNAGRILSTVRDLAPEQQVVAVDSLESAVRTAESCLPSEGVVLLSPGAPSFGEFRDYRERGRAFQALVVRP
ncbi:MAG: UDP-N-acetylmuramoyl-L-alanine--D-glutamate ligase [Xanthomonadales bacterium]|nr:UDP-N-acetylmuramoyl-L-alanine--D-glutamate ligase [Xanthomonadales bacterium]